MNLVIPCDPFDVAYNRLLVTHLTVAHTAARNHSPVIAHDGVRWWELASALESVGLPATWPILRGICDVMVENGFPVHGDKLPDNPVYGAPTAQQVVDMAASLSLTLSVEVAQAILDHIAGSQAAATGAPYAGPAGGGDAPFVGETGATDDDE